MGAVQNPRINKSVSMASATSLSGALYLEGYRAVSLDISSGWDAANQMTFQGSNDGVTFFDLYDTSGAQLAVASGTPFSSAAARSMLLDTKLTDGLSAHAYVKFRSGPTASPVNLTTGVLITLALRPL